MNVVLLFFKLWANGQNLKVQLTQYIRKDLNKFISYYKSFGEDSLILAVLAYNCGSGKVNESSVLQKLKSGNRDILKDYLSYCHYKGKFHSGLYRRRYVEYQILFNSLMKCKH